MNEEYKMNTAEMVGYICLGAPWQEVKEISLKIGGKLSYFKDEILFADGSSIYTWDTYCALKDEYGHGKWDWSHV